MVRLLGCYYRFLCIAVGVLTGVLIVPVVMQVLARYTTLVPSYQWTDEVARFCLVWTVMLGSIVGVREGTHFTIDVLPAARTPMGRLAASTLVQSSIVLFSLLLLTGGIPFARFGLTQHSEIADIRMVWVFASFPLAAVSWLAFSLERIASDWQTYHSDRRPPNVAT